MPSKTATRRARKDLSEGKRPTTAAGEFVREEMEHVKRGKHGARNRKQIIAIGLSQARRAGIPVPPRKRGKPAGGRGAGSGRRSAGQGSSKGKPT